MPTHYRTCTLCEAMCGLAIEHAEGRVTAIRGDDEDVLSRGHICPKGVALMDLDTDPDRLRRPQIREGTTWREAGWDEAIAHAVQGLKAVQAAHGRDAVAVYNGNPTVHSLGAMLFVPPFVRALRTRNRYSATSVDQLPHHVAAARMFGHGLLLPIPDVDRTDFLLILGANPAASNGSLMSAGDAMGRIRAIRERGGRVVVIDPRRTETARVATAHHFVRPGSDALLLLAMLHVILAEGLERTGHLTPVTDGIEVIGPIAARFTPERVARATGIDAGTIRALARDFASAERAVCYGRVGVSMHPFGTLCAWLITVLNALTNNLDREGGAMFTHPAIEVVRGKGGSRMGRWRSRVRGLPEFDGELPVAALADEIETPGEGRVRALVTQSGNPVLSTPNGARLDRALASLDFMVAIDFYRTETTRHAHVILPPTGPLERDHYDLAFHALAVRNVARFSPALRKRDKDARHDWEILAALGEGLSGDRRARWQVKVMRTLGPARLVDLALRTGPYGAGVIARGRRGLALATLRESPHGVDLGPLRPAFPERLRTPDRRIALAPADFVADVARLEAWLEGAVTAGTAGTAGGAGGAGPGARAVDPTDEEVSRPPHTSVSPGSPASPASPAVPAVRAVDAVDAVDAPLSLIGRRLLRSNNSWMHNAERLVRGKPACTLLIHPDDATARGIATGDTVRLASRTGSVDVPAEVSDAMMPGVVSLPHGFGHTRPGTGQRIAAAHAGASINDVTDEQVVDAASGNAVFSGVPVTVARVAVPVPAAT
jgi:anaerobic selenocysteine-containing dehydrogenase